MSRQLNVKSGGDKGGFSGHSAVVLRKVGGSVASYRAPSKGAGAAFGSRSLYSLCRGDLCIPLKVAGSSVRTGGYNFRLSSGYGGGRASGFAGSMFGSAVLGSVCPSMCPSMCPPAAVSTQEPLIHVAPSGDCGVLGLRQKEAGVRFSNFLAEMATMEREDEGGE